jgi:hypothetical protein
VAGPWGVGDVPATARDVVAAGFVPVVVCGRNAALRRRIAAEGTAITLGWVSAMPLLLHAADVVVHNAGGLSSMEAMASQVPVISYRCRGSHRSGPSATGALAVMARRVEPAAPLSVSVRRSAVASLRMRLTVIASIAKARPTQTAVASLRTCASDGA